MSRIARAVNAMRTTLRRRARIRLAPCGPIVRTLAGLSLLTVIGLGGDAVAGNFLPLGPGDFAEYRDDRGGAHRRVEPRPLDSADSLLYDDLAGLGSVWIRVSESGEQVFARPLATAVPFLLADFAAATGTRFAIAVAPCNEGAAELASRDGYVATPAGTFRGVVRLDFENRCPEAGLLRAWFAPGVGLVRYELSTANGPLRYDLVAARIGTRDLPRGERGLVVSARLPGPVVPGPVQLVLGGGIEFKEDPAHSFPERGPSKDKRGSPQPLPLWEPANPSDLLRPLPCPAAPICTIWIGKTLFAELEVRNPSRVPTAWSSPTHQLFEITLYDQRGRAVSRWSSGRAFVPFPLQHSLEPGESLTVSGDLELLDDWGLVPPPGPYVIEIEIIGSGIRASSPLDILPAVMPVGGSSLPATAH